MYLLVYSYLYQILNKKKNTKFSIRIRGGYKVGMFECCQSFYVERKQEQFSLILFSNI